jgi:hypothetical protein
MKVNETFDELRKQFFVCFSLAHFTRAKIYSHTPRGKFIGAEKIGVEKIDDIQKWQFLIFFAHYVQNDFSLL